MIEQVIGVSAVRELAARSDAEQSKVELYCAFAVGATSHLAAVVNDRGWLAIFRRTGGSAFSPSIFLEHFNLYRAGGSGVPPRYEQVDDLFDFLGRGYERVWLSYDNLPPNEHVDDNEEHWYNLLPLQGLTHDGWMTALSINARAALRKALARTEAAEVARTADPASMERYVCGEMRAHYFAKYADRSMLEGEGLRETLLILRLLPCSLSTFRLAERYSFLLTYELCGARHILFVGGNDPPMIRRAYYAFVTAGIDDAARLTHLDAGSETPYLKRQMGFRPVRFFAFIRGADDWQKVML